ncbi:MAG: two-component system response regulator [Desulfuromonadales bacterium C00003096]|nr:MAG: two-component system response regulator [Desulfuromonadales bacterium C00003096]
MGQRDRRVLVVDDEENARIGLSKILEQEGYRVDSVANGREALDFLQRQNVQVVISDLQMPEMNGMNFLRELNRHYPRTQVIMVTAHGGVESYLEAIHLGAYEYINKPIKLEELRIVMDKMLTGQKTARAN